MEGRELIIVENAFWLKIKFAWVFIFINMGFKHKINNSFSPSYPGERLLGKIRYLIIVHHGCCKFFQQPPSDEVAPSDLVLLGWNGQ